MLLISVRSQSVQEIRAEKQLLWGGGGWVPYPRPGSSVMFRPLGAQLQGPLFTYYVMVLPALLYLLPAPSPLLVSYHGISRGTMEYKQRAIGWPTLLQLSFANARLLTSLTGTLNS